MLKDDFAELLASKVDWKRFAGKTILITGANGLLPSYMVETLLLLNGSILNGEKCNVIALVRDAERAKARFCEYESDANLMFVVQDVCAEIIIQKKVDYIIHAASAASPKYYSIDPVGVIMPNLLGTKSTLDLAVKDKVISYLYFSSAEVYGELSEGQIISESKYGYIDPTAVRSCYGESKRMGENICISYSHQHGVPAKIVRPAHTYGPGMKLDDGRVFSDFVKNIVLGENIELKSDGSASRAFCYISDATIAFFTVLLNGENGGAYNVSNPDQMISVKMLAELLVSMFPEKKLKVVSGHHADDYLKSVAAAPKLDISKLEFLGWSPSTSIKDGFSKTIKSYINA